MLDPRIDDGTLARAKSPVPSLLSSPHLSLNLAGIPGACPASADTTLMTLNVPQLQLSRFRPGAHTLLAQQLRAPFSSAVSPGPQNVTKRSAAHGKCAYLNPQSKAKSRVKVPKEEFDRLREKASAARISEAISIKKSDLTDLSEWPNALTNEAIRQDIVIDGQTIRVIRPTDAQLRGINLPTVKQLAEALRTVPMHQREFTKTLLVRTSGTAEQRGLGGGGVIELFPVAAEKGGDEDKDYRASPQTYFDILVMHECAHNYVEPFWHGPEDVADWDKYAKADNSRPSHYAADGAGEDFCEFMVLYNAAVGTQCEEMLKKIYPNRCQRLAEYQAA